MSSARRPSFSTSFGRAQVASFAATIVDFGSLVFLVEVAHVWYVAATAIGAALGAVTNFVINRHWSFEAADRGVHGQAFRYALVSTGSLLLNSGGVYLLTDFGHLPYPVSKAIIAFIVGIAYNFPMHRGYVFKV
jgi:putative flippase GtrA